MGFLTTLVALDRTLMSTRPHCTIRFIAVVASHFVVVGVLVRFELLRASVCTTAIVAHISTDSFNMMVH